MGVLAESAELASKCVIRAGTWTFVSVIGFIGILVARLFFARSLIANIFIWI